MKIQNDKIVEIQSNRTFYVQFIGIRGSILDSFLVSSSTLERWAAFIVKI